MWSFVIWRGRNGVEEGGRGGGKGMNMGKGGGRGDPYMYSMYCTYTVLGKAHTSNTETYR